MKKKIGIRYCGGCRSQYDRVAAVSTIEKALESCGVKMVLTDVFSQTQTGLLVCGCLVQCAAREEELPSGWHILGPENLFDRQKEDEETIIRTLCAEAMETTSPPKNS